MKTGLDLIAQERAEQIEKHGFSLEKDSKYYKKKELVHAAFFCLQLSGFEKGKSEYPHDWGVYYKDKMERKTPVQQLIVAGALLRAENERRGDNLWSDKIKQIAVEIDRINNKL